MYVEADLLSIEKSTSMRNNELINCRYFGKCSGCQFQNIEYQQQLAIKKQTIINAYDYFARNWCHRSYYLKFYLHKNHL